MKILFNFLLALLITASAANGQGILKGSRLWLYNNTDSSSVNSTTGIMRYDQVTGKYRFYNAVTGTWFSYPTVGGNPPGSAYEIPFTNAGATALTYDPDFSFDPTSFTFKAGNNISITGVTSNYNFLTGDGTALTGTTGDLVKWATIFGEASTITISEPSRLVNNAFIIGGYLNAINLNAGGGNIYSPFILGTRNTITNAAAGNFTAPMIIGYRSTTSADMSLVTGFRGHATSGGVGAFVHGFSTTYTSLGNWTGTVEPVTAGGRHAVNISANSEAQTVGHGAYGDYSAILGGIDADIPSTSPRSVVLGGSAIKARASDPDQVYAPNLNVIGELGVGLNPLDAPAAPLHANVLNDGVTNDVSYPLVIDHENGTFANDFGVGIRFDLSPLDFDGAAITAQYESTSLGSEDVDLRFRTARDGAAPAERLRLSSTGAIGVNGANYGTAGQVLTSQGSSAAPTWESPSGGTLNTDVLFFEQDEWLASTLLSTGWQGSSSGTGAGTGKDFYGEDNTEHAYGTFYVGTGTTATGFSQIFRSLTRLGNGNDITVRMRVAVENLSDGTETYAFKIGFNSATAGAYFRYTHSVNGGRYECVTATSSVETATDSGVTVDTQYHILEMRIAGDLSDVEFYIDGALVATNSTNMPVNTDNLSWLMAMTKSAGTTDRRAVIDWHDLKITRSTAR